MQTCKIVDFAQGIGVSPATPEHAVTARHIYVDETKHRDYVMVAAVVLGEDLTTARAVVQDLLKPGQHHLHMKDYGRPSRQS